MEKDINSEAPKDPNEIVGLDGYDVEGSVDTFRWVSATQTLAYTVYFENDADFATAAASKVTINVPLHSKLNYATLRIGSFGFGSHIFAVEGSPASYQTRIDLRDSLGIFVDVVAGLDIVHNEAFWIFQSIDPATGLPPTDINSGFLPINDSLHSGEGFVTFTIKPQTNDCLTGDTVTATASIVFDVNEAIPTNTWLHTIDAFPPTSTLHMVPNGADQLTVTFSGEDDEGGCGIKQFKLYCSQNEGAYQLYAIYPVGTSPQIPLETGIEYRFFVLAEDNVGNCEPMKNQPEFTIGTNFVTLAVNSFPAEAGSTTGAGTYSVNETAELTATAAEGYHFVHWMQQGAVVSTQDPYSLSVTQNQTYTAYFERDAYTLQTIAATGSVITVTDLNGNEVPSGSTILHFDKLIVSTDTADCYVIESVLLNGVAYMPGDTIYVTDSVTLTTTTEQIVTFVEVQDTVCQGSAYEGYGFIIAADSTFASGLIERTVTVPSVLTGCDSIVTLHLTVNPADHAEFTEVVCGSYAWNDSVYTRSGDYVQTFTNASGCDSVVTLHLTVNYTTYGQETITACDSFSWHGSTYTQSGDYPFVTTNAANCDSIVTLHLTVNHTTYGQETVTACDSFSWHGSTYTQSGDYPFVTTNAANCDSIVTLHLTVNYSNTGDTTAVACDRFDWYEHTNITSSCDNLTHTFTNAHGCDSVVTLHLTVNYSNTGDTTAVACDRFDWYEHNNITSSCDNLTHTFTNANGCDSVVTLHLTVNYTTYGQETVTACDSFTWHGSTYTQSGDYPFVTTNAANCDSIVTLHLTVNHTTYGQETVTACDSFSWHGSTYTQSGDYPFVTTNAANCDSIVTLHLTVNHTTYGQETVTACDSFSWHGHTYTSSGTYTHAYTNPDGCASVDTLKLTVNYGTHNVETETACENFTWHGHTYTNSGTYTHAYTNTDGCASVDTLKLTVNYGTHNVETETACESFIWHGHTYTSSGTYTHAYTNNDGCASVDTLKLTVNYGTHNVETETACESFIWHGQTYTNSGTYTHAYTNADGCASVDTLKLTINYGTHNVETETACENFTWHGHTYTNSGTYTHAYTNPDGCSSVDTLKLTVNHGTYVETSVDTCGNGFYWTLADTTVSQSGTYYHYSTNANTCTDTTVLRLALYQSATTELSAQICAGEVYVQNGFNASTAGDHYLNLQTTHGCDSTVVLHLAVGSEVVTYLSASICEGDSYQENGFEIIAPAVGVHEYFDTIGRVGSCDSIVTLTLTVHETAQTSITEEICANELPYHYVNGQIDTTFGVGTPSLSTLNFKLSTIHGCDSTVTLHLTVTPMPTILSISGDSIICKNQYATYYYDISDHNYTYLWLKDNFPWAENVSTVVLHEEDSGTVFLTMQVGDPSMNCMASTSMQVQIQNSYAPDTTVIRRKGNSNILICQPVTSEYGTVHYQWGYADRFIQEEVLMDGDYNYCQFDVGIDTSRYEYWVETYVDVPDGLSCANRTYYGRSNSTSVEDYNDNRVEAYFAYDRIMLSVNAANPSNIGAGLYDVNGRLLLLKEYGRTDHVQDAVPVHVAVGVYFLKVNIGGQVYSVKLLKF